MRLLLILTALTALALTSPAKAQFDPQQPPFAVQPDEKAYMRAMIHHAYRKYLRREPDPSSEDWVTVLAVGTPPAMTLSVFLSSVEYYLQAGNSPEGFVSRLFTDATGRPPSEAELLFWVQRLGESDRPDVVYSFLKRYPPALVPAQHTTVIPCPTLGCHIRPVVNGVYVQTVQANTVASQLGFQPGDIIQNINGVPVFTQQQINNCLLRGPDRAVYGLTVIRNKQRYGARVRIVNGRVTFMQGVVHAAFGIW
jgi:membrane-associated protease RseP (regulator of RpoE activity)